MAHHARAVAGAALLAAGTFDRTIEGGMKVPPDTGVGEQIRPPPPQHTPAVEQVPTVAIWDFRGLFPTWENRSGWGRDREDSPEIAKTGSLAHQMGTHAGCLGFVPGICLLRHTLRVDQLDRDIPLAAVCMDLHVGPSAMIYWYTREPFGGTVEGKPQQAFQTKLAWPSRGHCLVS